MISFFALPLGLLLFSSGLVEAAPCKLLSTFQCPLELALFERQLELFLWYPSSFPDNYFILFTLSSAVLPHSPLI